jgi:serine/threonine protein kinase
MPTSKFKATSKPPFPDPGSTVGHHGRYFCLGRLGAGTFCEISRCIDLSYFHSHNGDGAVNVNGDADTCVVGDIDVVGNGNGNDNANDNIGNGNGEGKREIKETKHRIVAAKIELTDFKNSGVLDGEATILRHLSNHMPKRYIPTFLDYLKTSNNNVNKEVSTIIMECLAGEDMNKLRDRNAQYLAAERRDMQNLQTYRRLCIKTSVYLCKEVFLVLLQSMHDCGAIHRDVKPSNCVRTSPRENDKLFKLVDFGLSKSFVVPKESSLANQNHTWDGPWDYPPSNGRDKEDSESSSSSQKRVGCIRKERSGAEFRGTSMYASLRVHQNKDYGRRDDIWGLMYVFCDLVSGGLPWMGYAANRDRAMCQLIKEYVHGERETVDVGVNAEQEMKTKPSSGESISQDRTEELLMGAEYHLSKHRRDSIVARAKKLGETPPSDEILPKLTKPLAMMKDATKCNALRRAFDHLSKLSFSDKPDYDLIGKCFDDFLINESSSDGEYKPPAINWKQPSPKRKNQKIISGKDTIKKNVRPSLAFMDESDIDPLCENVLEVADAINEKEIAKEANSNGSSSSSSSSSLEPSDVSRLPLQLQFYLAQVEYNATTSFTIPTHLAFRDWMNLGTSLVYDIWDAAKYEKGNHRSNDDGYRRELYLQVVHQCLEAAKPFANFSSRDCYYYEAGVNGDVMNRKRRKIMMDECKVMHGDGSAKSTLLAFSKVMCALRASLEIEKERIFAPPPSLSFGG